MATEYYYNLSTGDVEEGRQSYASNRMGPYATREEAAHAFARAKERNKKWEADDEEWED